jgi:hypothetical protein
MYSSKGAQYIFVQRRPIRIRPKVPNTYSSKGAQYVFVQRRPIHIRPKAPNTYSSKGAQYIFVQRCPIHIRPKAPNTYSSKGAQTHVPRSHVYIFAQTRPYPRRVGLIQQSPPSWAKETSPRRWALYSIVPPF